MAYDIFGQVSMTASALVVPAGRALQASTSVPQALAVHLGKTAIAGGTTYGVNKIGEQYGLSDDARFWIGVGSGIIVGIVTQKIDEAYNLSGFYSHGKSIRTKSDISSKDNTLSFEDAEELAWKSIKGRNKSERVVLGKYEADSPNSYTEVAKEMDAQYFELDNWNQLASEYSLDEIWKINEKFLDIQSSSGREIFLSHDPELYIGETSFFSRELHYLIQNGYELFKEGGVWRAVR
jgi:hypothetical protein